MQWEYSRQEKFFGIAKAVRYKKTPKETKHKSTTERTKFTQVHNIGSHDDPDDNVQLQVQAQDNNDFQPPEEVVAAEVDADKVTEPGSVELVDAVTSNHADETCLKELLKSELINISNNNNN